MNYKFSAGKNQQLIQERNVSFEEVIAAINDGKLLDVVDHSNTQYKHQRIYMVEMNDYVYLVPFVMESEDDVFLKTIIPSRKAKKRYKGGQ